jgi:hypothetical protein
MRADECASAFEPLIPSIERVASFAFRHHARWRRLELVADVIAAAYAAFVRLVERGLQCLAYPTVLAKYAVHRVRAGRQFGEKQNVHEILSPYAQRKHGFGVEQLPRVVVQHGWNQLTADSRADPSEVAALRLDLWDWLSRLTSMKRLVAWRLAMGDTTGEVAQRLGVSAGRISQIRRELHNSWQLIQLTTGA